MFRFNLVKECYEMLKNPYSGLGIDRIRIILRTVERMCKMLLANIQLIKGSSTVMNCYLHCQSASVSFKLQIHLDVKIVISDHHYAASFDKLDIRWQHLIHPLNSSHDNTDPIDPQSWIRILQHFITLFHKIETEHGRNVTVTCILNFRFLPLRGNLSRLWITSNPTKTPVSGHFRKSHQVFSVTTKALLYPTA